MATDFTQETVLDFIVSNGGTVRNASLLAHFKEFLREHEDRAQNRELFKKFVNSVASVRQEDGVCYVVLKKKIRPHLRDIPANKTLSNSRAEKVQEVEKHKVGDGAVVRPAVTRNQDQGEVPKQANNLKTQKAFHVPVRGALHNTEHTLPVAGIVNNSNNNNINNHVETVNLEKPVQTSNHLEKPVQNSNHLEKPVQTSSPLVCGQTVSFVTSRERVSDTVKPATFITDSKRSSGSGQSWDQSGELKSHAETADPKHNGVYNADLGQLREADDCSQTSSWPPLDYRHVVVTSQPKDTAQRTLNDYCPEEPWPFAIPLGQSQCYASSPCLADLPAASCSRPYIQAGLSLSNDSLIRPIPGVYIQEPDDYGTDADILLTGTRGLLSSQSSLFPTTARHRKLSRDEWSSEDALDVIMAEEVEQEVGLELPASRRLHEAELLTQLHRPERRVAPWHHSTGNLLDQETEAPFPGRSPPTGPVARRLSQRVRSRMCRSLGAGLDQAAASDESEPARLRRLRRISSFLSDRPASGLSCHAPSTLDGLSSAGSTHSLPHDSQVPLEPREHEWFAKAASGIWAHVYSLFREEPALLRKRDFVTGFTVLHWIAKHGDHRVLNTLWYGVDRAGLRLDVDARTACGYTPLHLAALHGHKKMLRLLVHKFGANAALRDNSGKKAWQYLEKNRDWDLLQLLGAPQRALKGSAVERWALEKPPALATAPSTATVKRHSSLAALFRHKSRLRVSATAESFL